jgi:hypothetical protein
MSTLGCITLQECDLCKRIATLQSEDQYQTFESTWYDGWSKHFCPTCRETPEALRAIEDDRAQQRAINRVIRKYAEKPRSENAVSTNPV